MSSVDPQSERQKLEKAIQAQESLRGTLDDAIIDATVATLKEKLASLKDAPQQQRKLVTVLFMDIVGSTGIIHDLDPEDNMAIMDTALQRLAEPVAVFQGRVSRFMGDGFMALFGAPVAQENDPEMAVRAGLEILSVAQEYAQEVAAEWGVPDFNVRVGIHTGRVMLGGFSEAEDTVMGAAVNLAARLESTAPPGGLLISHETYQHVRGLFDVEAQEPIRAKGFPDLVPVYLVRREKAQAFQMETRGVEGLETRTVGREKELQTLQEAYRNASNQKQTSIITLVGEAGVGKSRLAYEFSNWLELQPETIWYFRGRALQQTQDNPQSLLRDMLADRFQIRDSDPVTMVRDKFTAGVGRFMADSGELKAHILGAWLGYDFHNSQHLAPIEDEPEQIKNQATLYLAQLFAAVTEQGPTVVLLDDIHWADGGSLETVMDLARRQPNLPLLVVCLARPTLYESLPDWGEKTPHHTRLDLDSLSAVETRALVAEILRRLDPIPPVLIDLVSSRAEGNPFYAEELIKMLIDDGAILIASETWQVVPDRLVALKIPATLTGVLQARLDKLHPDEKQAAQAAAVVGRIFWEKTLEVLAGEVEKFLSTLHSKELIFPRRESSFTDTREYIFKHAILREVIYETVLKRVRAQYHARIADWLVEAAEANERTDEFAALIGEHFLQAGRRAQAVGWYGLAGRRALSTYSNTEAVHYLSKAFDLTPARSHADRFAILDALEIANNVLGNREAQQKDLDHLAEIAVSLGALEKCIVALKRARFAEATSDYGKAISDAQAALASADLAGDKGLTAEGYWIWGSALYRQGHYPEAQDKLQKGLQVARELGDKKWIANCLNGLGLVVYEREGFGPAREYHLQALQIRREIGDRLGEGVSLNNLGITADEQGDYSAAKEYYQQSQIIRREIGDRRGEGELLSNQGFLAWNQGNYDLARECHEEAFAIFDEIGDQRGQGVSLNNAGLVAIDQGDPNTADSLFNRSLNISREIGDRWGEGITLINFGELALAKRKFANAETMYQAAQLIHQELNQRNYIAEGWAGLARLKLAKNDLSGARRYANQVFEYLQENPVLEGLENPMRAFRFTWETFSTLGDNHATDQVLGRAVEIMQDYLVKNLDPDLKEMYLRQPHHSVLWEAWKGKASSPLRGEGEN